VDIRAIGPRFARETGASSKALLSMQSLAFRPKQLLRQPGGFEGLLLAAVLRVQRNAGDRPVALAAQDETSVGVIDEQAAEKAVEGVRRHVGGAALELAVKRRECDRPLLGSAIAGEVDGTLRLCVCGRGPVVLPLGQAPENNERERIRDGACEGGRGGGDEGAGDSCDHGLAVELAEAIDAEFEPRRRDGKVQRAAAAPADVGHPDVVGLTRCRREAPKADGAGDWRQGAR